jgi:type I restriction enzyme M protein
VRLLVQLVKPQAGNTIYDPTVGSGGFLIQSHQYVEEQGQDPNDLALYGQDSNGTVWSICNMNMILHNIARFTIENGDTLEDPLLFEDSQVRKFDRVLANPPFSQNYSRASLKFSNRFHEFCPETGKKADLMFVQHMIASLKPGGHMATVMPHGVLFRGGKEKLIREILIEEDVIEAIISLPPGLFYGTGIPACVLVMKNKSKPDELQDKILFINADREYAEGKAQNKLRPEDVEKIDSVFTHKQEYLKYSRLVDKQEIVEQHDYNLNIRRYVDNTPEPEPEDVKAHLMGGIPEAEIAAQHDTFAKFGVQSETLFESDRPGYAAFCLDVASKAVIKERLEANADLQTTVNAHHATLESWWQEARDDFAKLEGHNILPQVRQELLTSLKGKLIPLGVLDEFQSAGVFVNWWQQIRYDLKTIINTGWHHTLIPDEYLLAAFFQEDVKRIEELESKISAAQGELSEAVESAQEVASYEPEEGETVTAAVIKKALKELIDDLKASVGSSAAKERQSYEQEFEAIAAIEKRIKQFKDTLKQQQNELELKLRLKRIGGEEAKAETSELLQQVETEIEALNPNNKDDKKKITALHKDKDALNLRLSRIDGVLTQIGGQLTDAEAKTLILKKLYDWVKEQLTRYLNVEKRVLIARVENLWDKYAVSSRELEMEREETLKTLDKFLSKLGYLA